MKITKYGFWFYYKGDKVLRKWPWRKGKRYVSLCCEGEFNSLKDMDEFWTKFFKNVVKEKQYGKNGFNNK